MAPFKFNFSTLADFDVAAKHIEKYCRISRALASDRLHKIKHENKLGGADNVIFDRSGGVYNPVNGHLIGSLTAGGSREKA